MKNIFILVISIFIGFYSYPSFSQTVKSEKFAQTSNNDWKTFRSEGSHFRFIYPPSWSVKTPRGKNVKALVSGVPGGSGDNCNVLVKPLPDGYSESDFWNDVSAEDMTPENALLITSGETYLNNRNALLSVYDMTYKTVNMVFDFRVFSVVAVENNALYTITCGSQAEAFESSKGIFNAIISSFVFETWEDSSRLRADSEDVSANDIIFNAVDTGEYGLLSVFLAFSFIVTWGIGLIPPLLIRYVFYRRPLKKWSAIGYCTIFLFVNIGVFTALGSESKTHTALMLIAFVSYYILKRVGKKNGIAEGSVESQILQQVKSKTEED